MAEYTKPLPLLTSLSKIFYEGCKENKLLYQHCKDCGEVIFLSQNGMSQLHGNRPGLEGILR